MKEEARTERRAGTRREVILACDFNSGSDAGQGVVINLSPAGAFVRATDGPPPGALADLILRWGSETETHVSARVVHRIAPGESPRSTPGFGLYFVSAKPSPLKERARRPGRRRSGFVIWSAPAAPRAGDFF